MPGYRPILYHFIQFGSHPSRAPSRNRNVTVVTAPNVDLPKLFSVTNLYAQFFAASGGRLPIFFAVSRPLLASAETKISVGPSRVTMPAELNEMVQYYYDQFGRGWDMGQAGRNLDVGHLEGGQGTCLDFGQSKGSATCSMLLCGTSTKSLYTL